MQFTQEDIALLRSIEPRKSILNFSNAEVAITSKFQAQFFDELDKKSPYVRRMQDWREFEETLVPVVDVKNKGKTIADLKVDIKQKISPTGDKYYEIPRGYVENTDTRYMINVGEKGLSETKSNLLRDTRRYKDRDYSANLHAVYSIHSLIKNGILLDVKTLKQETSKSPDGVFMHNLYAPFNFNSKPYIAKIAIQEILSLENQSHVRNLYNVSGIKIVPVNARDFGIASDTQSHEQFGTTVSVSRLFNFVKNFDKNFYTNLNSPSRQERLDEINLLM
jgi:hypothetical protein